MSEAGTPEISVVIPTRNEQENARGIARAVITELEKLDVNFELIFIDNASSDDTVKIIREMCASDPRIKLIINARNFGQMRSPTHGIFQTGGRAVINLCADFQDPPALIPEFIRLWRQGHPVVLGVRQKERNALSLRVLRHFAYFFSNRFFDYAIIPNATGFGLYDRKVVDILAAIDEPEPFFRGLLVETGYPITTIPFPRPPRHGGRSNNNFFTLVDFSLSAISGSGKRLLRIPVFLGIISLALMLALLAGTLVAMLNGKDAWPLLLWAMMQANFAIVFMVLGLMGDQVRLISERTRRAPLVIEAERVNFEKRLS